MIAVVLVERKFLVIKRSEHVRSPGMSCFPGGTIEIGETQQQALIREMQEELGIDVTPVRKVWESRLRAGWKLHWWLTAMNATQRIMPDPDEVEDYSWMGADEIRPMEDLLSSNREFFEAFDKGEIRLWDS